MCFKIQFQVVTSSLADHIHFGFHHAEYVFNIFQDISFFIN